MELVLDITVATGAQGSYVSGLVSCGSGSEAREDRGGTKFIAMAS